MLDFPSGTISGAAVVDCRFFPDRDKFIMSIISNPADIGALVRKRRKQAGLTLKDAAGMAGVGIRFLSELERGKPTLQIGKVIGVLHLFGLELRVVPRGESK